jgi:hypothetical protein
MTGIGEVVPVTSRRRIAGAEEYLHSFLNYELDGELVVNFTPRPASPPTQEHGYTFELVAGWAPGSVWTFGEEKFFSQYQEFNSLSHTYIVVQK